MDAPVSQQGHGLFLPRCLFSLSLREPQKYSFSHTLFRFLWGHWHVGFGGLAKVEGQEGDQDQESTCVHGGKEAGMGGGQMGLCACAVG